MKFFTETTVEAIKKQYRRLCMVHHPDRGGDTETMKKINSEYCEALKAVHGQEQVSDDGKTHTYYYNENIEQALMDKISELLSIRMNEVDIALIGTWLWITGKTKEYKDKLGKAGAKCKWHSKRKCWYWHEGKYKSTRSKDGLSELASKYGYRSFQNEDQVAIS